MKMKHLKSYNETKSYTKEDGTVVTPYHTIKSRKGFKVGDSVIYNEKEYKIHSFPNEKKDEVFLRKYRRDNKIDSRDRGIKVKINDITKKINEELTEINRKYLLGYNSEKNAYEVDDYPYGFRLRTKIRYWLETTDRGDRFCHQTLNPKTGRWNKPSCSTYSNIGVMYLDDQNHVTWTGIGIYTSPEKREALIHEIGGEDKLNPQQLIQLKQLRGEKIEIEGKKDFIITWERDWKDKNKFVECKLKFNRPDKVSLREIIDALKSTNQEKLYQVFANDGFVRISVNKGYQLGILKQETYEKYKDVV